jgi:hypothetical protein
MKTMTELQLGEVLGGGDTIQRDIGQFIGGANGWIQGNMAAYLLLGPGIGGIAAAVAGLKEALL